MVARPVAPTRRADGGHGTRSDVGAASAPLFALKLLGPFADIFDMAISIGNPSFSTLKREPIAIAVPALLGTTLLASAGAIIVWWVGTSPAWVVFLGSALIGTELYWFRDGLQDTWLGLRSGGNRLRVARGEMKVHEELMHLPDEYIVFSDFHPPDPLMGGRVSWDFDHIVIGPTGVFVVDAKDYRTGFIGSPSRDRRTRDNARQVDRCARDLKDEMRLWSRGALNDVFVVPVVTYAQDGVRVESPRANHVRLLPLKRLLGAILNHPERAIDMDKANRIAGVLYEQLPVDDRVPFEEDLLRYGEVARAAGGRGEAAEAGH
jgi:hypothetical protein